MNETKGALASMGVWGPLVSMAGMVLGYFGYNVTPDVVAEATSLVQQGINIVSGIMVFGGSVLGLIGRVRAKAQITGLLSG